MGDMDARCRFYVRTVVSEDPLAYRYDAIRLRGWNDDGCLHTQHPPMIGDQIYLIDDATKAGGEYRVMERSWTPSNYGSADWPSGKPAPKVGPLLHLIVERTEGLFRHETPEGDEEP